MNRKPLPLRGNPCDGECIYSFLLRCAAKNGVGVSRLLSHGQIGHSTHHPKITSSQLTDAPDAIIEQLSEMLWMPKHILKSMALSTEYPSSNYMDFALDGAALDPTSGEQHFSAERRIAWCPLCLLEDRASGGDHFLRLDWSLALRTMCSVHYRPLNERCLNCFCFVTTPDCGQYERSMAFLCPRCSTPLDALLGYDFVSARAALKSAKNSIQVEMWNGVLQFENWLLDGLLAKTKGTKHETITRTVISLADHLLSIGKPNTLRPLDFLDSEYFPTVEKLGQGTRHLETPFLTCHLIERRKALAVIFSLLSGKSEAFGFPSKPVFTLDIRNAMSRDKLMRFDQLIFDLAWMNIRL